MQSSLGISSRRNNNNDMKLNDSKCFYPTISGNEIRVCLFVYSGPGPSPVIGCPSILGFYLKPKGLACL